MYRTERALLVEVELMGQYWLCIAMWSPEVSKTSLRLKNRVVSISKTKKEND